MFLIYFISYGCNDSALVFLGGAEASASPSFALPMFITILKKKYSASVFRCASCHCGWHRHTLAHPWLRPCPVDIESSFQKTKKSLIIFVLFDTITLYRSWLERSSASNHQLLNSICVRWLALSLRQARLYSSAHYNQSHTILLSLWLQWPIRVTEFPGEFSHQKQQSAEVRTM